MRIVSLTLLCLGLLVVPALGQVYDNGPVNGNTDAWTINSGFTVSDSFILANGGAIIDQFNLWVWAFPGDTLTSVDLSISGSPGGGTFETVAMTQVGGCTTNGFGFNVCEYSGYFPGIDVPGGGPPSWVSIQNAVVPDGDPIYWDENSGAGCGGNNGMGGGCPSEAYENSVGTIPSEAFTLLGPCGAGNNNSAGCGPPVPEPGSIMLFGSGILGLAGVLRRKLF